MIRSTSWAIPVFQQDLSNFFSERFDHSEDSQRQCRDWDGEGGPHGEGERDRQEEWAAVMEQEEQDRLKRALNEILVDIPAFRDYFSGKGKGKGRGLGGPSGLRDSRMQAPPA